MSYMRGNHYLWSDDSRVHVWARDGYDSWDDSGWNEASSGSDPDVRPSGVALPFEVADEFAVMRVAELIEARQLASVVSRAIEKWKGNGGCRALVEVGDRLRQHDADS